MNDAVLDAPAVPAVETWDALTLADAPAAAAIDRRGPPPAWTEHQFRRETKLGFSRSHALRLDGRLAAFVLWWQAADEAQIANIAVHPDFRRRGYGRRLLQRVMDDAATRGLARVTLEVNEANADAIALYARFQFRTTGRRPNYYAGRDAALLMERTLPCLDALSSC